ncbi:MAG: glycosyltransferase [Hyphomonas sp.]
MKYPSFSIVINTLNRAPLLKQAIESFRWLQYDGKFEVIVVNGPSTDHTVDVLAEFGNDIRVGRCDVANLSVSRNVGICMASGDIIAFIDDDAVPEPEWLQQLAECYRDPQVGGAGGFVYDHTGYDFQYRYCVVDRLGHPDLSPETPQSHLCFPQSAVFPHLLGCNSSFRLSALLEIGGFDEEYEYYLDETDVCLRLIDAGYIISQLPNAFVHHKYAPSNIRGENKIPRNRYPVIKNKIYFTLKNSREHFPMPDILDAQREFIETQRNDVRWAVENDLLSQEDGAQLETDILDAMGVGMERGFEGVRDGAMITTSKLEAFAGDFREFPVTQNVDAKSLVFVCKDFPPMHSGGVATFNKDLAEAAARNGHIVHVVTASNDNNRVDFEDGVWVHRMVVEEQPLSPEAAECQVPQHIWNWSATALQEVHRIATHRRIDMVEAPIWDCEGIAFLLEGQWPLVTSLQTTLHFFLEYHPELRRNADWMASFGTPMMMAERALLKGSSHLRAISAAIRHEIQRAYTIEIPDERVCITPLGMPDAKTASAAPREDTDTLTVLFVGRLEPRKGIDVLLDAIPLALRQMPNIQFRIIGDDSLIIPGSSRTYRERFETDPTAEAFRTGVTFEGKVDDNTLQTAYAECDIFVAPSRFESFGLIYLEAMRAGKPVIGCRTGGIPEIVADYENGFLIRPGNVPELVDAIVQLAKSSDLRRKFGEAGLARFMKEFTSKRMADHNERLIQQVTHRPSYPAPA